MLKRTIDVHIKDKSVRTYIVLKVLKEDESMIRFVDAVTVYKCGLNYMWGINYANNYSDTEGQAWMLSRYLYVFMWSLL